MQSRFEFLRDRERGHRCVLVANGPSLNRMNLGFLDNEIVFGMNKIFLGFQKFAFYPKYYIAVNDLVIEQSVSQIQALNCIKFLPARSAHWVPENALTYHINTQRPAFRFCGDINDGVHEGWTVTYAALQVAYFLGFEEVVIIGMDHHYEFHGQPNEEKCMQGDDPNHFAPNYFGGGQQWHNPDLVRSEESYAIAREMFERDGRRIIDATLDGRCTVFEKQDCLKIF